MNYRLSLNKFGNIDLGGKFSYMMRSHISVISFNPDSSLGSEVSSQDYDQGRRFFISAVARYSIVTFKINDSYSITPTYTFNYSILNSSRNTLASDSLTGHLFEVILTRKLSKINRHKYLHNRHLHM